MSERPSEKEPHCCAHAFATKVSGMKRGNLAPTQATFFFPRAAQSTSAPPKRISAEITLRGATSPSNDRWNPKMAYSTKSILHGQAKMIYRKGKGYPGALQNVLQPLPHVFSILPPLAIHSMAPNDCWVALPGSDSHARNKQTKLARAPTLTIGRLFIEGDGVNLSATFIIYPMIQESNLVIQE